MESVYKQPGDALDYTPDAAQSAGEVFQLKDGRAACVPVDVASGALGAAVVTGVFTLEKTASIAILNGGRVYWDHSANKAHFKKVNDRDFYVGRAVADSSESDTTVDVALNIDPRYDIDLRRDAFRTTLVGTAAAGGFGYPVQLGGSHILELTATNEAQKVDLLSVDGFATGANAIIEGVIRVLSDGSGTATDVSIGVANDTHASDAGAITESIFIHLDGNATTINAESDDGTTEVAQTDTTKTYTEGATFASRTEFWIDMRDPTDVQIYVDGVNVLPATVFGVGAATGPWYLLAHVEKSSSTDTYKIAVDRLCARLGQK